jgi:uncharacterized OsmC-like protein
MPSQDEIIAEGVEVRDTGRGKFPGRVSARPAPASSPTNRRRWAGSAPGPRPTTCWHAALGACTAMT